jgi:hypothetical protein
MLSLPSHPGSLSLSNDEEYSLPIVVTPYIQKPHTKTFLHTILLLLTIFSLCAAILVVDLLSIICINVHLVATLYRLLARDGKRCTGYQVAFEIDCLNLFNKTGVM